ncbi:LegC2/C7 family Dot/Icm T4SS effector [Legionella hackeliae]|uniref:Inclusion membrane protein A [coiled-coil domain] n=1 Tax=Legionella hackeliae TaxID=449 RepID=A0A0A8URU9_LEGHA|nr:LegC2/C7 family Dot/Icm T4SS effector [Legionella hackeliae]KTD15174.1 inclusion membrane protein A [Legionella hackeliae]CEK11463.1 Inclusion membrane protein A [coiled-coil domain] [Legionella hackeliae]STX48233.1 inclusion membrane protein A [Legionella hackeliae]
MSHIDQKIDSEKKKTEVELETLSTPQDELAKIALTQQQLGQIKQSLGTIIDTMQQNDSLISRAANFWGNLPLWQKIVGGIVLTVPTLAAGVAAHIGILLAISGVTVVAYTASGIVLDDHHSCNKNIADRLKEGIFCLADVLEITIAALDKIRENLAKEIDRFRSENDRLTKSIDTFNAQMDCLTNQVEVLTATAELLKKQKEDLEQTTETLQKTVQDNDNLLRANHDELTQLKKDYEKNKIHLSEKVGELAQVRSSLGLEVQKAKKIAAALQGTVQTLSETVIADGDQRLVFQQRLDKFLSDEKMSFASIADRICKAERELAEVKEELKHSNERYEQLLQRQELQVERLEKLDIKAVPTPNAAKQVSVSQLGFYAAKQSIPEISHTVSPAC